MALQQKSNIGENYIAEIITIHREVIGKYAENTEIILKADNEVCDLEHELELTEFDSERGYAIAKEIQNVKRRRRIAKDENELLEELANYCGQWNIHALQSVLGKCRKLYDRKQKRRYFPRVRSDLTIPAQGEHKDSLDSMIQKAGVNRR